MRFGAKDRTSWEIMKMESGPISTRPWRLEWKFTFTGVKVISPYGLALDYACYLEGNFLSPCLIQTEERERVKSGQNAFPVHYPLPLWFWLKWRVKLNVNVREALCCQWMVTVMSYNNGNDSWLSLHPISTHYRDCSSFCSDSIKLSHCGSFLSIWRTQLFSTRRVELKLVPKSENDITLIDNDKGTCVTHLLILVLTFGLFSSFSLYFPPLKMLI